MISFDKFRAFAAQIKRETSTLYLAARDPRTPWYAKAIIACVVAYALSPIDLIPDFIPMLGYLDDLLLLPIGIYFALKLIPAEVLVDARLRASDAADPLPKGWSAALVIVLLWIIVAVAIGVWIARHFDGDMQAMIGA